MHLFKLAVATALVGALAACSGGTDNSPLTNEDTIQAPLAPAPASSSTPCDEGSKRSCRVVIAVLDGIENCFVGKQTCVKGAWTECQHVDGEGDGDAAAPEAADGEGADASAPSPSQTTPPH